MIRIQAFFLRFWISQIFYIRGMILKFWSWRDISVTSNNATCLKIVQNTNTFFCIFVYTGGGGGGGGNTALTSFFVTWTCWRSDRKYIPKQPYSQCTDPYQARFTKNVFMAAQCSSVSQYVLYIKATFLCDLGFLGPLLVWLCNFQL